jgi:hypothetical protein
MLPVYIIEDILKREKEAETSQEVFIECPLVVEPPDLNERNKDEEPSQERGIAIIDFTI